MKKILVLSSYPAPYRVDVFKGLATHYEMDVFFATDEDQNRSKEFFCKRDEFYYYVLNDAESRKKLKLCVKNIKQYSLVLAYDWYLPFALKIEALCIVKKIPYIINCDGAFFELPKSLKGKLKAYIKSVFVKNARLCFSSGEYATRYFMHYGAMKESIKEHHFTSLHSGDVLEQPVTREEKESLRNQLGLQRTFCVVAVGQFIARKGFDVLLKAWKQIDSKAQLVLIGGGMLENEYRKYIQDHGYRNVEIIRFVPKEKVMLYLKAADLFVLPTREDIWGLVVNEALASGIPVVSSDKCIAGLQMLKDNLGGYIVPADDPEALAKTIATYMQLNESTQTEKQREALGKAKDYTIENIVSNHVRDIDAVLKLKEKTSD